MEGIVMGIVCLRAGGSLEPRAHTAKGFCVDPSRLVDDRKGLLLVDDPQLPGADQTLRKGARAPAARSRESAIGARLQDDVVAGLDSTRVVAELAIDEHTASTHGAKALIRASQLSKALADKVADTARLL